MKLFRVNAWIAALLLGVTGCRTQMIVEAKDVKFYEISHIQRDGKSSVHIKGLVFHSSLAVERISTHIEGDAVIVEVFLTPTRKGLSGSFDKEIDLPPGTSRVLFGPTNEQIWPNRK